MSNPELESSETFEPIEKTVFKQYPSRKLIYERAAINTILGSAFLVGAWFVGSNLIDRGKTTIETQVSDVTSEFDLRYKDASEHFETANKKFDAAKKQCEIIEGLEPEITSIAGALNLGEENAAIESSTAFDTTTTTQQP